MTEWWAEKRNISIYSVLSRSHSIHTYSRGFLVVCRQIWMKISSLSSAMLNPFVTMSVVRPSTAGVSRLILRSPMNAWTSLNTSGASFFTSLFSVFIIGFWIISCFNRPHQYITGHFGDESFQSITCTGTDNLTRPRPSFLFHAPPIRPRLMCFDWLFDWRTTKRQNTLITQNNTMQKVALVN